MVRTIPGKTKGKAKERPKRQAACITKGGRELVALVIGIYLTASLMSPARTSANAIFLSIAQNSLASSLRTKAKFVLSQKINQQTRNPAAAACCCCCYYCP
jgi:hypothetical protein